MAYSRVLIAVPLLLVVIPVIIVVVVIELPPLHHWLQTRAGRLMAGGLQKAGCSTFREAAGRLKGKGVVLSWRDL